jgi:hypothetical protein
VHKPSISAWYELATRDRSQKLPVSRNPVLLQNIIQPTPLKFVALYFNHTIRL